MKSLCLAGLPCLLLAKVITTVLGRREVIAGSSWCPLAQNPLYLDTGRAAGYKLISNLLLRTNLLRKL